MFNEAMLEMEQELFDYKQNELEHYLCDYNYRDDYESPQSFPMAVRTIGGVKL